MTITKRLPQRKFGEKAHSVQKSFNCKNNANGLKKKEKWNKIKRTCKRKTDFRVQRETKVSNSKAIGAYTLHGGGWAAWAFNGTMFVRDQTSITARRRKLDSPTILPASYVRFWLASEFVQSRLWFNPTPIITHHGRFPPFELLLSAIHYKSVRWIKRAVKK